MSERTGRVAMLVAPRTVELREEPVRTPSDGALLLRVRAALTDGTDLKTYRRGHPLMPMPTRFGHEFSGDVVAVGRGVTEWTAGDAVACVHSAPCGQCFWCLRDEEELCESLTRTMVFGAYADYIEIPARIVARNCYRKPDGVSYVEAAFLEPLACVVHSAAFLGLESDSFVAVYGDGAFGILHALLLARDGHRVVLCGRRTERLALARELGVDAIDVRQGPAFDAIRARTEGRGADALVECTGNPEIWELAPSLVRRGGTVSFFGGLPSGTHVSFEAGRLHYDEVRLVAPFHFSPQDVRRAYDLIASRTLPLLRLTSQTAGLDDIASVFAALDAGNGMKAVIEP
ncbi:MAG TPA: alcohol dehydrogenase catalytic domain-containing protein [Candidatus Tumulicola sp.]